MPDSDPNVTTNAVGYSAPDSTKLLLGELVLAFGYLEHCLDLTFKRLIQHKDSSKTYQEALALAYRITRRLQLEHQIRNDYELIVENQDHEAQMEKAIRTIDDLYADRNRLFHGFWHTDKATGSHHIEFEHQGKPTTTQLPSDADLRKLIDGTRATAANFDAMTNPRNPDNTLYKAS